MSGTKVWGEGRSRAGPRRFPWCCIAVTARCTAPLYRPAVPCHQVSDIADCVRQRVDAVMLCGETAAGAYPLKSLEVLRSVAARIEQWMRCAGCGAAAAPNAACRCPRAACSCLFNSLP